MKSLLPMGRDVTCASESSPPAEFVSVCSKSGADVTFTSVVTLPTARTGLTVFTLSSEVVMFVTVVVAKPSLLIDTW